MTDQEQTKNHTSYYTGISLFGFPLIPLLGILANDPSDTHWEDPDQKLPWEDLKGIVKQRLQKSNFPTPTSLLASEEIDYLPFSTLEEGVGKGLAVCRILLKTRLHNNNDTLLDKLINLIIYLAEKSAKESKIITSNDLRNILKLEDKDDANRFELNNKNKEQIKKILQQKEHISIGTGFLVGRSYLLTNYHVIDLIEEKYINSIFAEFGYDYDSLGRRSEPIRYQFESFESHDNNLDYALIKLKSDSEILYKKNTTKRPAGELFGFIQLSPDYNAISHPISEKIFNKYQEAKQDLLLEDVKNKLKQIKDRLDKLKKINPEEFDWIPIILQGEPAIMIQYPTGEDKQIVLTNNRVIKINKDFLYYETDSDHGCSGSPIFNKQWELVGMNRAAVYVTDNSQQQTEPILIGYEGTRICKITEDLISKLGSEILREMNLQRKDDTSSSDIRPGSRITNKPQINNNLKGYFSSPEQF